MRAPGIPELLVSHWELAPSVLVPLALAAALYLWGARRVRGRWPLRRTLAFMGGLALIVVALQSGLGTYDDTLLSAHMVQHILLLLPAPLLMLWGRPVLLGLRALPRGARRNLSGVMVLLRPLGHWACGLLAFYLVVIVPHVPAVFDASLRHPLLHDLMHLAFLTGGLLFLWPLFGAPIGRRALGSVGSLCYVLAVMPSCALIGSYLDRAAHVVYGPYLAAGRAVQIAPLIDQQQAGAIMWVGAHVVLTAIALGVLAARLTAEERRQQVRDLVEDRGAVGADGTPGAALT